MRLISSTLLVFTIVTVACVRCQPANPIDITATINPIDSTDNFVFYGNYWVNLHHFLYERAQGGQKKNLEEDGNQLLDIGENLILDGLTDEQKKTLDLATSYYRENIIQASLLGSTDRLIPMQQAGAEIQEDSTINKQWAAHLNSMKSVYNLLWPLHQQQIRKVLEQQIEMVDKMEETIIPKMVKYSGEAWSTKKLRVDLTAYGSWSGAYTTIRPTINVVISTLDPGAVTPNFLETVFHEGSHTLFARSSPLRANIYYRSEELEVPFPRGLWHAALFYLCGRSVQDEWTKEGVSHELMMDARNIFSRLNTEPFRDAMEKYYQDEIGMEEAIDLLLKAQESE